jgi:hypothetical protein
MTKYKLLICFVLQLLSKFSNISSSINEMGDPGNTSSMEDEILSFDLLVRFEMHLRLVE